jgi:Set1/Ash2 histone methyltransferase complex subunit ASH2
MIRPWYVACDLLVLNAQQDGFQYIYSEQDPHAPMDFDPEELAGKPIPSELYRPVVHDKVLLSLNDRAPQLKVGDDRLSVTGDKGYCMIRATHGVSEGTWYFEVDIKDMSQAGCAVRLGWAQVYGNLQAPCGFDKFSYSWRSKKGTVFHHSRGKHYSDEGFATGDTLGVLLHLPPTNAPISALPITHKGEVLIKFKNFFYFEHKDTPVAEAEQRLQYSKGSRIIFYKNGVSMGTAFNDIYSGTYYPAISLYKNAEVCQMCEHVMCDISSKVGIL